VTVDPRLRLPRRLTAILLIAAATAGFAAAVLRMRTSGGAHRAVETTAISPPVRPQLWRSARPAVLRMPTGLIAAQVTSGEGEVHRVVLARVTGSRSRDALVEWWTHDEQPRVAFWYRRPDSTWAEVRVPIVGRTNGVANNVLYTNYLQIDAADVTGDGRAELLVDDVTGNHGCGTKSVYRWKRQRLVKIFELGDCERYWEPHGGKLLITQGLYRGGESVCCPSYFAVNSYGFNGARLVVENSRLYWAHE
jgi:hypothetical protein